MHRMRKWAGLGVLALLTVALAAVTATAGAGQGKAREYVVVYEQGVSAAEGRAAIKAAGGTIVSENAAIGVATVRSDERRFVAAVARQDELKGAAPNEAIGRAPREQLAGTAGTAAKPRKQKSSKGEPLAALQWDMTMIGATADGSHRVQKGSRAVRVGVIDTGMDASHPDIKPNFDRKLSRNFTIDDPVVDGTCDTDPDGYCTDPADVDEGGHGTHVAGIIGGAINNFGTAGVAPKVDLVNLRAGQDSGYFFLGPTLDALTYAGDNGIDVVNMSFYIDPWLYNCRANPADNPQEQAQQALIIDATQRALKYARDRGVTLVASAGNNHTDKGNPVFDDTSPDYPDAEESPRDRTIDNACMTMPSEGTDVIGVTAIAPSKRKSYYSDYGVEQADVSAPGGDSRDGNVAPSDPTKTVLSSYPLLPLQELGLVDEAGNPLSPAVIKECSRRECAYYRYLQGTSMAAPHATGVAALAVAQFGTPDGKGGIGLAPAEVERLLQGTATDTPCPEQNPFVYTNTPEPIPPAFCEGTPQRNGFYGDGIVDAQRILIGR
jgi:lantibiotic leader peptide-processing serine protease